MSVVTISPSIQNISVAVTGSDGIVTLTQSGGLISTVTINQGQQGPAGASLAVTNPGDNRILTSDGSLTGVISESNLLFDGFILTISGIPVSLSGHSHVLSDISGISGSIGSGIDDYLSNLSLISNECDIEYIIIQNSSNNTQLVNINNLANALSIIDGGGVSYSGC